LSTSTNIPQTDPVDTPRLEGQDARTARARSVHRCDFRLAGQLANEDARALTELQERVAAGITARFDASFGTAFDVRFNSIHQISVKDHVAQIPALCYIVPFSSQVMMVEFDLNLVFPMVELLLGGAGEGKGADRDLSEIEDGIMQDVVSLVTEEAEAVWAVPGLALEPGPRIMPPAMLQLLRPTEKLAVMQFDARFADASGTFSLALSSPLLDSLVTRLKSDRERKKSRMFTFPVPPLRERILDCDTEVTAELPAVRVRVRDLVSLEPGSVLKLRAPIRTPAVLTLGDHGLFEAVPVRSGQQRAAQLGRRSQANDWKGDKRNG